MSRAGAAAQREPEDYYTTPSWCVRRFLERWRPARAGCWVEPGAGNGAIIRVVDAILAGAPHHWHAFELREEERPALTALVGATGRVHMGNYLNLEPSTLGFDGRDVDAVLGNPPYNRAFEFLRQSRLLFPRAEIALLLRQAFTASAERYDFMRSHVPDKYELPNRPSFTGTGGGDSADYAWMVWPPGWERDRGTVQLLAQTPEEERSMDKGHRVVVMPPQMGLF